MSSNTSSNQNEPSGYINISAAIRATFNCCINNNTDVNNNKVNDKDLERTNSDTQDAIIEMSETEIENDQNAATHVVI